MIFMGPKMNVINSIELLHTLKEKFSIDISLENLNGLLPNLCTELGMKTESLISLQDAGEPDPPIATYLITLFNSRSPSLIGGNPSSCLIPLIVDCPFLIFSR